MIFHCKAKSVSRGAGRSAVAAAAYRSAERLEDERTGTTHDFRKKRGVVYTEIVTPDETPPVSRRQLWNMAEAAEKRKDAKVAREWELGLPVELNGEERKGLVQQFAKGLVERFRVAVDIAVHMPGRGGDIRNHHAHLLTTTRTYTSNGLGEKTRVLDSPRTSGKEVEAIRELWERLCNTALSRAGRQERADRRTLKEQGVKRPPTHHLGPAMMAMERRGIPTFIGDENRKALNGSQEKETIRQLEAAQSGIASAKAKIAARRLRRQQPQKIKSQYKAIQQAHDNPGYSR